MRPQMTEKAQREIEAAMLNNDEAHVLLDLVLAEWDSDPMSQQCFDSRIVERARLCVAKRKAFVKSHYS